MPHFGKVPRSSGQVAAVLSVGMAQRIDRRRAPRALRSLAVALLAAAMISCGGAAPTGKSGQSVSVQAGAATREPAVAEPGSTGSARSEAIPAGIDGSGLEDCEDVAKITASIQGPLRRTQNYPSGIQGAVWEYGSQLDTFGGYWLDRDNGGTIMVGFTDEVEMHEAALLALPPSSEDGSADGDMRPLGQRDDVAIEVVQVTYSERELLSAQDQMSSTTWNRDLGIYGYGIDSHRNRVNVFLENPPPGTLAEVARSVPSSVGLDAVCLELTITEAPPAGPLLVLPDLSNPDPVVTCWGVPPKPYSELMAWQPVDEVDHPAVDVFRGELAARQTDPTPRPLPEGDWAVVHIDPDLVRFVLDGGDWEETAAVQRRGDRWLWAGEGSSRRCEPSVVLPQGLGRVDVHLDPDSLPDPDDTEITLLVIEQGCASGRTMGDALRGPQVVETDESVVVAFAVVPVAGGADCPDNPPTSVTITLSEQLGNRAIQDGLYFPPKTVTAEMR